MTLRTIPRVAIGGSLTLLRLPVDGALRLAGGRESTSSIALALDRADATARRLAGVALADQLLIQDAARRRAAADERETAQRLQAEAVRHAERAEERVDQGRGKAARTRARASEDAERRRSGARKRSQSTKGQAAKAARKRQEATAKSAADAKEAIEERDKRSRLADTEKKAEALKEKETALTAQDESRRLQEAASQAKAERKAERS